MWMKASPGLSTTASISLRNTYVPPPEYPAQYSINSGTVSVGDTWTRVSVSGYLLEYPTSDYQIYIDTGGPSGTYLSHLEARSFAGGCHAHAAPLARRPDSCRSRLPCRAQTAAGASVPRRPRHSGESARVGSLRSHRLCSRGLERPGRGRGGPAGEARGMALCAAARTRA